MKIPPTILPTLVALLIAAALLVPHTALAAGLGDIIPDDPSKITLSLDNPDPVKKVIAYIINFGLAFAGAIAAIFVVVSGYQYIVAAGNPEKIEKAKMGLTWSISGFGLVVSAYAIVYLVQRIFNVNRNVAQQIPGGAPGGVPGSAGSILERILDLIFTFGAAIAIIFLIIGGYRYVTSQGNPELVEKAKKTVLYSIIGLVVIFVATVTFRLLQDILQVRTK